MERGSLVWLSTETPSGGWRQGSSVTNVHVQQELKSCFICQLYLNKVLAEYIDRNM